MRQAARRKYHYIYKTTCIVTGKYYYGMHSTDDLDDGYLGSGSRLSRSIKKHGRENHTCEILEHYDNRKLLREREKALITDEKLVDPLCMNLRLGGDNGAYGRAHTEETRRKMSESHKGKVRTQEHCENLSKALTGYKWPEERKKKFSERVKGRVISEEQKRKTSEKLKGRKKPPRSEEHSRNISEALRDKPGFWLGKKRSEETKQKISKTMRGRKLSETHKNAIREGFRKKREGEEA